VSSTVSEEGLKEKGVVMYRSDASPGGPGLHPGKLSKMFSFAKLYHISKSLVEKCHIKEFHDDTLCKRKCNLVFYI
jgi:hypothetical protein